MDRKIRVVELFAGVGGFRLGLERASDRYEVVWSNQYEPATPKTQHASDIYVKNFGPENHHNCDISDVPASEIPDHDLLVGGFPCQDYSVARTLNHAKGLVGKKGVLWWEIYRIAEAKQPKYLFLENVDRLLKSPAKQRGRDFAIMLASLSDLGYAAEWRVINAADYGMPQRRRRTFILAYSSATREHALISQMAERAEWISKSGRFAETFPIENIEPRHVESFKIKGTWDKITKNFNKAAAPIQPSFFDTSEQSTSDPPSPFRNAGVIVDRNVTTVRVVPRYDGPRVTLGDILLKNGEVPRDFYLTADSLEKWVKLKGAKKDNPRTTKTGFTYNYNEGPVAFPDPLDKPSRTIITGEGGSTPSRFKHVICDAEGHLRRLTPVELERLNMFPDNHTAGVKDIRRAFFMGNALVVGIVERVGKKLANVFDE